MNPISPPIISVFDRWKMNTNTDTDIDENDDGQCVFSITMIKFLIFNIFSLFWSISIYLLDDDFIRKIWFNFKFIWKIHYVCLATVWKQKQKQKRFWNQVEDKVSLFLIINKDRFFCLMNIENEIIFIHFSHSTLFSSIRLLLIQ